MDDPLGMLPRRRSTHRELRGSKQRKPIAGCWRNVQHAPRAEGGRFEAEGTSVTNESRFGAPIKIAHGGTHPEGGYLDQGIVGIRYTSAR